jgi:hypothetical protein
MMKKKNMDNLLRNVTDSTPRRGFLGRAVGAMAVGLAGFAATPVRAQTAPARSGGPDWPGALKGRHRQVVDGYEANAGFPLAFAYTFLVTNEPSDATAVIILRHGAFSIALGHEMWRKYKIGESFKIIDPETKASAVKNPFLQPKPGVLLVDDIAIDKLLANGAVIGACNIALQVQSKMLAGNAGVTAEAAAKEFAANIVPGVTVLPSGTWGVNRAQEAGCTYCAGG